MSTLKKIIDSVHGSDEKAAELRETLIILAELAASKAASFEDDIQSNLRIGKTTGDLTVPVTKIIKENCQYRATSYGKTSDVLKEVTTAITDMFNAGRADGIISGMSQITTSVLDTIMSVSEGEEQSAKLYLVVADYPAIV